ncbi:hypothetical protein OZL92_22400 [Bacillus sonorensis]|uniref:Uncharacterized protein n=1 Tax=Bacillus sonorensis L12 TaxID=1274524 RepID=M5P7L2_9BACI|nr:hypothetical protein [Bacillus sonorensis]EME75413.1 hypothetical protein BSONL12_06233 [Bacillus sonorensis L12]MCZ0074967.1 hypothetical protein [Bacillus sonorensis]MCZ0094075.1 hypothetical protein [Bacillus sonorensis]MDR4956532.1 hypothetical protein [Bacillus sonorensis]PAD58211.1 hypothetical protein CHH92_21590 [Bacillus sonorensis]
MKAVSFVDINELLTEWAANDPPIEDFTVENVMFALGVGENSYEFILRYLMSKKDFELIPKKMLLCPSNHKVQSFDLEEPIEDEFFECVCGEIDFIPENFLLVFQFTDQFKSQCQKKKSQTKSLRKLLLV